VRHAKAEGIQCLAVDALVLVEHLISISRRGLDGLFGHLDALRG